MPGRTLFRALRSPGLYFFLGAALILVWIGSCVLFGVGRGPVGDRAPEFQGIHNWINSEPLTMEELRGNVVLVDFWTYTCINCIRTLPYLKEWDRKYAGDGLVIVGVHSPEFEFEKDTGNVIDSAGTFGLEYAIAQDNDFETWRAYENRYWPAKYLIDKEGYVRFTHFGEGAYAETEEKIRELLADAGADLSGISPETSGRDLPKMGGGGATYLSRLTRELYGGYDRNTSRGGRYIAHEEYYEGPNRVVHYRDEDYHEKDLVYLNGPWFNGEEAIRHARETEQLEDYIGIRFSASTVNAVIHPGEGTPYEVDVTLDGQPLSPEQAGGDVAFAAGRSYVEVEEARLYRIVSLPFFSTHELKLSSNSDDFALFAFTFGT